MKKFLRGYFLLFASHPIIFSFVLAVIVTAITYLWNSVNFPQPSIMVFVITCIHAAIVYLVIAKYITRNVKLWVDFLDDDDTEIFTYVTTENGKNIIFSKPIWVKGEVTRVHLPNDCTREVRTFNDSAEGECSARTNLICNYKKLQVHIPIMIKITLDDNFNNSEVLSALTQYGNNFTTNNIECYITYCFRMANKKQQDKLDELTKKFAEKTMSELNYIDEVAELINFPEKLFSNFKRTSIKVGSPIISCEKDADAPKLKNIVEVCV